MATTATKSDTYAANFEKRPIEDVMDELGIDYELHQHTDRPYLIGFCPFPDHSNTDTPAFNVFLTTQHWVCHGCAPEGGDVIDLVKRVRQCKFNEAKRIATLTISDEEHLLRTLKKAADEVHGQRKLIMTRATRIFDHPRAIDHLKAQEVLERVDLLLSEGRWLEADKLLRVNRL